MNQLSRFKDTVLQYISPDAKRRRTIGPDGASNDAPEHSYLTPVSEPHNMKAGTGTIRHAGFLNTSPSNTKQPRKRGHDDIDDEEEASTVSPMDSISQGPSVEEENEGCTEDEQVESEGEGESDEEAEERDEGSTDDEEELSDGGELGDDLEEEEEIDIEEREKALADAKVQEYLARQAELALRKEEIEQAKATGTWHPDELFLFERLALRSFEEILPAQWKIDLQTLPEDVFSKNEGTFINSNCTKGSSGMYWFPSVLTRWLILA